MFTQAAVQKGKIHIYKVETGGTTFEPIGRFEENPPESTRTPSAPRLPTSHTSSLSMPILHKYDPPSFLHSHSVSPARGDRHAGAWSPSSSSTNPSASASSAASVTVSPSPYRPPIPSFLSDPYEFVLSRCFLEIGGVVLTGAQSEPAPATPPPPRASSMTALPSLQSRGSIFSPHTNNPTAHIRRYSL